MGGYEQAEILQYKYDCNPRAGSTNIHLYTFFLPHSQRVKKKKKKKIPANPLNPMNLNYISKAKKLMVSCVWTTQCYTMQKFCISK